MEGKSVLFMHFTQNQWYSWISICCIMSGTRLSLVIPKITLKDWYKKSKITGEVPFQIMRYNLGTGIDTGTKDTRLSQAQR